ncbi:hypothetical protein ACFCWG_43970 [Streptomyces sp. NPDC056390]|uniref:hypothetical protein n=1 Tax=Streptomyces sp. NPDC056390 TaxID=3345806 RepID=UPI0035DA8ACE
MLLRLAYLSMTNAFAALRLLPMSDRDKDAEKRRGEVREGPLELVALPIFAALHVYAGLSVRGMLPPDAAGHGLDAVIASTLRGCMPE